MRDGWEAEAGKWAEFARTPGHDSSHDDINLPALRDLLPQAVAEAARVLERGGRLCASIPHPVNSAGVFQGRDGDAPFLIAGSYLDAAPPTGWPNGAASS